MHDDDEPVGRLLDRRHALLLLGAAGAALTVVGTRATPAGAAPTRDPGICAIDCVVKPEQMEGPYFVDEKLNRSDIRTDPSNGAVSKGTAFALGFTVLQVRKPDCLPIKDAVVDVWQCDATGLYSDIASLNSAGQKFLRGYQTTDADGKVGFTTILPGWYEGRTIHIHIKIRTTGTDGKPYEFTSQLYLPEPFNAEYLMTPPYSDKGPADTVNSKDSIFTSNGGAQLLLNPRAADGGYAADFTIALDLSDTEVGKPDGENRP